MSFVFMADYPSLKYAKQFTQEVTVVQPQKYLLDFKKSISDITYQLNFKDPSWMVEFDGLNAAYIVYISTGPALKIVKKKSESTTTTEGKRMIAEGKYDNITEPVDVIKALENLFGVSNTIPSIKASDS